MDNKRSSPALKCMMGSTLNGSTVPGNKSCAAESSTTNIIPRTGLPQRLFLRINFAFTGQLKADSDNNFTFSGGLFDQEAASVSTRELFWTTAHYPSNHIWAAEATSQWRERKWASAFFHHIILLISHSRLRGGLMRRLVSFSPFSHFIALYRPSTPPHDLAQHAATNYPTFYFCRFEGNSANSK